MLRFASAITTLSAATLIPGFALFSESAKAADGAETRITFQSGIMPILAKHCQTCHRPGQVAPMSFLTYKDTRRWAPQIKALVADKKMPPVVGTAHYSVLTRGEGLTQGEINALVKWVDEGAPESAPRGAKPRPPDQGKK